MTVTLVGNFEELTEQDERDIDEWVRSPETAQRFREVVEKVQQESDAFRKRIFISYGELQSSFGPVRK